MVLLFVLLSQIQMGRSMQKKKPCKSEIYKASQGLSAEDGTWTLYTFQKANKYKGFRMTKGKVTKKVTIEK